jgi:integrase
MVDQLEFGIFALGLHFVTAHQIAQQPKAAFVAGLRPSQLPDRVACQPLRTREYLTEAEVERLMAAAKGSRYGHRDSTMALVAYRHGLRASELVDLRWEQWLADC